MLCFDLRIIEPLKTRFKEYWQCYIINNKQVHLIQHVSKTIAVLRTNNNMEVSNLKEIRESSKDSWTDIYFQMLSFI